MRMQGVGGEGRRATNSSVEIEGGALVSGGRFTPGGTFGPGGFQFFVESPAVAARGSTLDIGGGDFQIGPVNRFVFPAGTVLRALESRVEIRGGRFAGFVELAGSRSRIVGGELRLLSLGLSFSPNVAEAPVVAPGCTEMRGGRFGTVSISSPNETLFIFGTEFNHPFGPVPITSMSQPIIGAGAGDPSAEVTGVLPDGTALDLDVDGAYDENDTESLSTGIHLEVSLGVKYPPSARPTGPSLLPNPWWHRFP